MRYKHLTGEQRYTIEVLLQTSMSRREIAEFIGVSKGTACREIRRNCDTGGYGKRSGAGMTSWRAISDMTEGEGQGVIGSTAIQGQDTFYYG